jgi:uncharacterized protein (DUF2062 family)
VVFSWRRVREEMRAVLHLDEEPSRLATAMAVGVFIGITPVYGLHTFLALLAAWLFRLNKAVTITGAWLNLPWFAPFVYTACLALGQAVLSGDFSRFSWAHLAGLAAGAEAYLHATPRENAGAFFQFLWDMLFKASLPLLVGTTIVGALLAGVAYVVTLEGVRDVRRLRHRLHHEAPPPPVPGPGPAGRPAPPAPGADPEEAGHAVASRHERRA